MGIELTDEQVFASLKAENWFHSSMKQVFEITGPGGSGKTFLVQYIIERLGLKLNEVLFVSFSGKAVSQLAKHGLPAKTIHSTIYNFKHEVVRDENGDVIYYPSGKPKLKPVFELKDKDELPHKVKLFVVDEGSMVERSIAEDLLSFGIPTIVLGDLNQLPPVFGKPYFLQNPDIILTQIHRQRENDPIIYLSQRVLHDEPLIPGVYGKSAVILRKDLQEFQFKQADIVLTRTNRLRWNVNNFFRTRIHGYKELAFPHIGEKLICRKNDWDIEIDKKRGIYLTNGTAGICNYCDRSSYDKSTIRIDFIPDFSKKALKNLKVDYQRLKTQGIGMDEEEMDHTKIYGKNDVFEYAYAITTHSSQGSEWNNVLFLVEDIFTDSDDFKKFVYTGITRARESLTIVL